LTLSGKLLDFWGEKLEAKGGLWGASKAIPDGKGHYYLGHSQQKDSLVRIFDGSGNVVQQIKTGVSADSLALDSQGRLFVVSYGDYAKVYDPKGSWLGYLVDEAQPAAILNLIGGICILPDGMILTCGGNIVTLYRMGEEKQK
jgi:hypothetical protein